MKGKKSRIHKAKGMGIDRISNLPDSILGHILSFLLTKEAVATSILSKRWKFTWSTVHDFHFSYFGPWGEKGEEKNKNFVEFVNRVLLLHDGGSINKFKLACAFYNMSSHFISWINFAITRNVPMLYLQADELCNIPISVFNCDTLRYLELFEIRLVPDATAPVCLPRLEILKLSFVFFASMKASEKLISQLISGCPVLKKLNLQTCPIYDSEDEDHSQEDEEDWCMPVCVFSCESLQSLELGGYLSVPATIVVCCTRLEILKLSSVTFESEEACEKFISGFPMLRYLYLCIYITYDDDDDDYDVFTCIISSASLRHLKINFKNECSLKLKASSLESFEVEGDVYKISVEKSLRSLVQAEFRNKLVEHGSVNNPNNSIVEAFRAFHCAKVLTLSASVIWALSHATVSLSTEFKRLVKLEAGTFCSSLQDIIQNSNNLQDLVIYSSRSPESFNCHDHPKWTTPVEVPRCLSNSLKSVHFSEYVGSEGARDMIRYILEHGSALKFMRISCDDKGDAEMLKMLQEIRVFPRKFTACEVHFSWDE